MRCCIPHTHMRTGSCAQRRTIFCKCFFRCVYRNSVNVSSICKTVGIRSKTSCSGSSIHKKKHLHFFFLNNVHPYWGFLLIGRSVQTRGCRIHTPYQPYRVCLFHCSNILVITIDDDYILKYDRIVYLFYILSWDIPLSAKIRCGYFYKFGCAVIL